MADLLIELFSEEIPARMQAKATSDLKDMVSHNLKAGGLGFDTVEAYATPRRLALSFTGIPTETAGISEERRGPRVGAPEQALAGFMRGAGVTKDQLFEREEKKGTFYFAKIEEPGRATPEVIAEAIDATVRNFPWPKSQRWGDGTLRWVRPLHSILCVFDGNVVEFDIEGVKAGNSTSGHRFMAPGDFTVTDFVDYKQKLLDHKVILDPARRQTLIRDTAQTLASAAGLELVEDAGLFAEVAGLVEWPVPMIGSFDANFLEVPEEVLILTMKKDQKYFVTRDPATGRLANKFIFTANIEPSDDGSAITSGNQRVLAARLADAQFFYEQDLKGKLEDNLPALKDIVFHKELGTVSERVERIKKLSRYLAEFIPGCDADEAERAAELCKADLVSGMVYEFPEVQGVMGRYYAKMQDESDAVVDAIRDHYAPIGPNDVCPSAPVSVAVALAEKLDTLVGFFGINQKPTGSKDPFALRRAALGFIRLITENNLRVSLADVMHRNHFETGFSLLMGAKLGNFPYSSPDVIVQRDEGKLRVLLNEKVIFSCAYEDDTHWIRHEDFRDRRLETMSELRKFIADRLKVQQRDKGMRHDLIDAVFAKGDDDLVRILNRVSALSAFLESDDGANLLVGYKRAANILKIEEKKGTKIAETIDWSLFEYEEEHLLAGLFMEPQAGVAGMQAGEQAAIAGDVSVKAAAKTALEAEDFEAAMAALSTLRAPIDAFFDKVKVNDDDAAVRANRLALLSEIRSAVNTVADFSLIEG